MNSTLDRRGFLVAQGLALAGLATGHAWAGHVQPAAGEGNATSEGPKDAWPGFPRQDPALVQQFVGASHRSVERVSELLKQHPALAACSTDWGYGDWESALGAASHVGNREIALLLLEHGARLDLFAATMLGMVDAVKAMVAAQPGAARTPGPHGISLLSHAKAGESEAMIAYISTLEGADAKPAQPLTSEEMKVYTGVYAGGGGSRAGETMVVSETRFGMALRVDGAGYGHDGKGNDVRLVRVDGHQFHPAGGRNVRVVFTVVDARAVRVEVSEAAWYAAAMRTA